MRPADSIKGRDIKRSHWIELSKKYLGRFPEVEELANFVSVEADIPVNMANFFNLFYGETRLRIKVSWYLKRREEVANFAAHMQA